MRYLFWLWFVPLTLFWGWFGLSYYDMNFGFLFLSRDLHDLVFAIYGSILHVDPKTIPGMFLQACMFDTVLIFSIIAFRKRRLIRAWWQDRRLAGEAALRPIPVETAAGEAAQVPAE